MRSCWLVLALCLALTPAVAQESAAAAIGKAGRLTDARDYDGAIALLRDALEAHPDDPDLLLELGSVTRLQAMGILRSEDPSLGRVALYDAKTWFERAAKASPERVDAWKGLGEVAIQLGEWKVAADAWALAVRLDPEDGESRYQLGYSLATDRRFEDALPVFDEAARLLGADPRVLLNRGITLASLGRKAEAVAAFRDLVRTEAAANRPNSAEMKSGVFWLWKVHSQDNAWAEAAAVFEALAAELPSLSAPWWYLGHARRNLGDAAGAAEAFGKVSGILPGWAEGWRQLGVSFARAGEFPGAEAALGKVIELDPENALELLLTIVEQMEAADRRADAVALLTRIEEKLPDDYDLIGRRADVLFRSGKYADAIRDYRRVAELDPFADAARVKEQKAVSALLRAGAAPADLGPLRPKPEERPSAGSGVLVDFESSAILARSDGAVTGRRSAGAYELERNSDADTPAFLGVTFMPTIDTTEYRDLVFTAEGPKGTAVIVRVKDCYDEFGIGATRLIHETPLILTGGPQTVTLPLDGFEPMSMRPIPLNRRRLRMLIFGIGQRLVPDLTLAPSVRIDDIRLVGPEGRELLIEDFDRPPQETLFLGDGVATPFAPTFFREQDIGLVPLDPNTFVNPLIFGEHYDPATVHGGKGSYRLTLPKEGNASGTLSFTPSRNLSRATAITFWARGRIGGERVAVDFRDTLDEELKNATPARAPRILASGRLVEGSFVLSDEWKRYRVARADLPDVDFLSLLRIRLRFGTSLGNEVGTTIWVDDIGWE